MFSNKKVLSRVPEGLDAYFLAKKIANEGLSLVHVARDDIRALALKNAVKFFNPDMSILDFPAWDCLPYDRISPNAEISCLRMATLSSLVLENTKVQLIITTANAISQRVPPKQVVESSLILKTGKSLNRENLISQIVDMGYYNSSTVTEKGQFAVRGGILDIFPPNLVAPIRLDFFGDQLDQAKFFDAETQLSKGMIYEILICPVSEFILNKDNIEIFRSNYRRAFGSNGLNDPLYNSVSAGRPYFGYEHWGPLFYKKMDTLLDYVAENTPLSLDYGVDSNMSQRWKTVNDQFDHRCDDLKSYPAFKTKFKPLHPRALYIAAEEWPNLTVNREVLYFFPMKVPIGIDTLDIGGVIGKNFSIERQQKNDSLLKNLLIHLNLKLKQGLTAIACYSEGSLKRMASMLSDYDFHNHRQIACLADLMHFPDEVGLVVLSIETGFESNNLSVITEKDILGERLIRQSQRKGKDFLRDFSSLKVNDLVVHIEHGIGKYEGLEKIKTLGVVRDYLKLQYYGNDELLLPVENIELLTRYGQDEVELDKLGSSSWQNKKARLKKRLLEMAENLIKLAADRVLKKGLTFLPPEFLWDNFCSRFPYQETDDQANAISDVLSDLKSGRPMDRLICGDVGFGKTEVAIRAAFIVASGSRQVAIITPTTLLSRQHCSNFLDRFRGLPFKIEQLSRFVSKGQALRVKQGLKNGTTDIVIGTHALLSEKIEFLRLGLVIIDEEQHFGVLHKEQLKKIKSNVHVLTLTATPIPRTLQLALSGARDLSIIATPPVDRFVVRTYVTEFDRLTVKDALLREYFRGGQSFFIVPRISDIEEIQLFLETNTPELKVGIAHGQMSTTVLDKTMSAFYDHQYDILLATSIIESGLDIPRANTLIVYKADMFGLAQLYQIRGRVGRSKVRAYAYLITDDKKPITIKAEKRLKVLSNIEDLGAGFSLASQDLDIRGAGNLLGSEQSGQIREVGFELYQSMLEEAVTRIRKGSEESSEEIEDSWSPEINLNVSVLIPESFVKDLDVRLSLYRKLSNLRNSEDLESFAVELHDRFGKLPREVLMLINIVKIKNKCLDAGIIKFDGGPRGAIVKFYKDKFNEPERLLEYIKKQGDLIKVRENKLIIRRDWKDLKDKIKGAYSIVSDLANLVKK